jgi:dipeptidyl aminopeptidase/acylaminoacyl peptidase
VTPEIIRRQVVLEEHDVSPDGRRAVIVRRFVDGRRNRYLSHLWLVPLERGGGRPRQLTDGPVRDTLPRFSPDGRSIAFRRRRRDVRDHVRRLMVVAADGPAGSEPQTVSAASDYVTHHAWSPDGRRLAYTAEAGPARFVIGRQAGGEEVLGRRIRRIDWRYDEEDHLDFWEHLFVVPARGGRRRRLTHGDFGVSEIAWHPGGDTIAVTADPRPGADVRPRTSIWSVDIRGGGMRELVALGGNARASAFSPDGRWIALVGVAEAEALDDVSPGLFVAPADGSGPPIPLAPDLDRPIGGWMDTDLNGWMRSSTSTPSWADPGTIVALVSDRGRAVPWRFPVDPETGRPAGDPMPFVVADAACWTLAVAPAARGGASVSVVGTLGSRAMELMTVEGRGEAARFRTRTTMGSRWQRPYPAPDVRDLQAPGPGGPIETWVVSPAGAGDTALPTVVDVHGGPLGAWAPTPSMEVLLLVSRGYRVVLPNIRGSATYGRDWIRPQLGDWGGVDAADVHAALDHVVGLGLADPDRLGVLGLSYGGFMVHWLIGTSDRFRAAVSENGVVNQINAWANSDTGVEYNRTSLLGDPLSREGMERLWRQSPLSNVARIRTPLLMFQAEADMRCPSGDNEQLFVALRVLGREVEYVLYPEEYHVYATIGRPDRRIDRMSRMLDWFDRWLKT